MNNRHNINKPLNMILKQNIMVDNILDAISCRNNCKYLSIKSLLIDISVMLSYADLLVNEDIVNNIILVPISSLFKYYKYLIKFIRLFLFIKHNNKTLDAKYENAISKLYNYILKTLKLQTSSIQQNDIINIKYKEILNTFHQDFFINRTLLLREYPELINIVSEYNIMVNYINKSRLLFKHLLNIKKEQKNITMNEISIASSIKKLDSDKITSLGSLPSSSMSSTNSSSSSSSSNSIILYKDNLKNADTDDDKDNNDDDDDKDDDTKTKQLEQNKTKYITKINNIFNTEISMIKHSSKHSK